MGVNDWLLVSYFLFYSQSTGELPRLGICKDFRTPSFPRPLPAMKRSKRSWKVSAVTKNAPNLPSACGFNNTGHIRVARLAVLGKLLRRTLNWLAPPGKILRRWLFSSNENPCCEDCRDSAHSVFPSCAVFVALVFFKAHLGIHRSSAPLSYRRTPWRISRIRCGPSVRSLTWAIKTRRLRRASSCAAILAVSQLKVGTEM